MYRGTPASGAYTTDEYNYYHSFSMKWVSGVGSYFQQVAGDRLKEPEKMLDDCKDNKGAHAVLGAWMIMMCYCESKRLLQARKPDEILIHLHTAFHILRCTNHYNVAQQLVRMQWYMLVLHPAYAELYKSEMTKSMSNRPSRGVSINHPVEDLNQRGNRKGKGLTDPKFLSDVTVGLNACLPNERFMKEWLGIVRWSVMCLLMG